MEEIKEILLQVILPTICGVVGSFIGMAIAAALGIL